MADFNLLVDKLFIFAGTFYLLATEHWWFCAALMLIFLLNFIPSDPTPRGTKK